jgi:protein glucosyltransferase
VLIPPRAYDALPDNARWAARASSGAWAWHRRANKAVFRGAASGRDRLFDANTGAPASARAKAVALSLRHPELLDARFSSRGGHGGMDKNQTAELLAKGMADIDGGFLTWHEALRYRASLVIDGNTVADRLAFVMASSTAVIKVDSPRREAFYSLMRPYVHYVPVKADASDLQRQLTWALANETRLHAIAKHGSALALAHLSRRATLCHWTSLLIRYATYMAGPVVLDKNAVRVSERSSAALPRIIEPIFAGTALRPQLSHSPPWPSDFLNLLHLHTMPCVGISWRHVCVDIARRRR